MTVKILAKSEAASHKREDERHVRCVHHIACVESRLLAWNKILSRFKVKI